VLRTTRYSILREPPVRRASNDEDSPRNWLTASPIEHLDRPQLFQISHALIEDRPCNEPMPLERGREGFESDILGVDIELDALADRFEKVSERRNGLQWRFDRRGDYPGAAVYFTHKRCCRAFEQANPGPWGAMGLDSLFVYLSNSLNLDWEAAKRRAEFLDFDEVTALGPEPAGG
jgi:hypothetical protein